MTVRRPALRVLGKSRVSITMGDIKLWRVRTESCNLADVVVGKGSGEVGVRAAFCASADFAILTNCGIKKRSRGSCHGEKRALYALQSR